MTTILAIDPGRDKCGIAVLSPNVVHHRNIVPRSAILEYVAKCLADYNIDEIVVGNGTGSTTLIDEIRPIVDLPISIVDESHTTERARARYFAENPPHGIRRFVPRGLLTPGSPIDDYSAIIIGENYLNYPH